MLEHEPIQSRTFARARKLLAMVPETFPVPEIGVDPDGEVAFDWVRSNRTMVSVSVGPGDTVSYAAGFCDGSAYGVVRWASSFPAVLNDLLEQLYQSV